MSRDANVVTPRVGFVGLGDIGEPMVHRIIGAGFEVNLWARRLASLDPFRTGTFHRAADLTELGRESDIVCVCVFSELDVTEVVLGPAGILSEMATGGVILIHSTVSVETAGDIAQQAATRGVAVLDVPVSGFRARAEAGQLTVMVGGPAETFEQVRPVLQTFGSHILHLGPIGSGLRAKALNQALLLANMNAGALALDAGRRLGLDRVATEALLRSASGASYGLDLMITRILTDPTFADLAAKIAAKDLAVYEGVRQAAGVQSVELSRIAANGSRFLTALAHPS